MKFADETALMFLMKSILLTEGIREKKMHFLNTRVLACWQNTFHPQMFWLSCQLFSMSALNHNFSVNWKISFVAALRKQLEVLQISLHLITLNH